MRNTRHQNDHGRSAESFRLAYKMRGLLMVPLVVFLAVCPWGETESDLLVFSLGSVVFGLELFLRVWAQMHLRYRLKARTILTQAGPYRHVRNPVYVGNILILLGCCFFAELFWSAPFVLLYAWSVYHFVVRYEEAHLLRKHGQAYVRFCEHTPRWVPRLSPGPACKEAATTEWIRPALVAEVHNLLLLVPFLVKEIVL
jgi:protein-S-isoprenylcysteine O-methyltransferase Ste14